MKKIVLISALFLISLLPLKAQQGGMGKTGSYDSSKPITGNPLSSLADYNTGLLAHEFWTDYNVVYKIPGINNPVVVSSSPYVNCGDFASDDYFYGTGLYWDTNLYRINILNGSYSVVGSISIPISGDYFSTGMAYNRQDDIMYLLISEYISSTEENSYIYSISLSNTNVSLLASYMGERFLTLAYDESSQLLFTVDDLNDQLVSINPVGWGASLVGNLSFNIDYYFSESDFNDFSGELYISHTDGANAHIYQVDPSDASSVLVNETENADFIVIAVRNNLTSVPVSIWVILSAFAMIAVGIVVKRRFF